ncbi:MAG: DEAD/DEAH box helicase [Desulforhopalus sp.]
MDEYSNTTEADPFFLDQEQLHVIAGKNILSQGLQDYKENRVMEIDQDGDVLWGHVEGEDPDQPENATIRLLDESLSFSCDCGQIQKQGICRHVVAVLCSYSDQCLETDRMLTATDNAIKNRKKRGRTEVEVTLVDGNQLFGSWRASSLGGTSPIPQSYQIIIRSLIHRANYCTCPDFTGNQLGTCKHIEAVLHKISKHPDYDRMKDDPAPFPYVYLAWDVEDAPQIVLKRGANISDEIESISHHYFSESGYFQGRLPEDFFLFADIVETRTDIHVGEDALRYARQLASAASRRQRSAEIKRQIQGTNRIPGVKARLYPYQVEGVAFLAGTGRALLADDMGLGKTLQAISAATWLRHNEGVKKTLIICPASLKHQWSKEITRFIGADTQVVQGTVDQRGAQYRRNCHFFIVNYELLLRDLSVINEFVCPDLVILDEAQRIKNWRTKIATSVKLIPSRYAFVLTGTPLENRLEDLYSLMQVVDPKILGPLWRYMIDFHITDDRDKILGYRNLSILRKRLEPVLMRRDRKIVSDQLPDRITTQIDVVMTEKQWELHDNAMSIAGRLAITAKRRPLTPMEKNRLMAALQQARMACNGAGLVDKETIGSPKIDELTDILQEVCVQSGLKAVVFSQWQMMTKMVETGLRRMNVGYVNLHGGIPSARRASLMDSFENDDSVQVFLSTDAGGVGLNLQSGSVLVNLDMPWNPAVLEQRNGRIHRLGQTRTVHIINMVAKGAYEERVLSLIHGKQDLFDNVISEDGDKDVVGVSEKLLETLVDDLTELPSEPVGKKDENIETEGVASNVDQSPVIKDVDTPVRDKSVELQLTKVIEKLQEKFGLRIERILGTGGGLLTVLDQAGEEEDRIAAKLSGQVPVAVIDRRTLAGLERLGSGSPLAKSTTYYDAADKAAGKTAPPRLSQLAMEKAKAAQLLIEQDCSGPAMELLVSALLSAAAGRGKLENPVSMQEAAIWVYSDALPKGWLNQTEATLIMRAISLAQSPSIPVTMLTEMSMDVNDFVHEI